MFPCLFLSFNLLCLGSPFRSCKVVVHVVDLVPSWWVWTSALWSFTWWWGLVPVFWWLELDLVSLKGSTTSSGLCGVSVNKVWHWDTPLLLGSVMFMFCWWFGIRHLALELSGLLCCMVLVLRWRPLGELLLFNIPWDWEFSHGATPWTQVSYLGDSGLTPSVAPRPHKPHSIKGKEKVIKGTKKEWEKREKTKEKRGKSEKKKWKAKGKRKRQL